VAPGLLAIALTALSGGVLAWTWRDAFRTWSALDRIGALVVVPGLLAFWSSVVGAVAGAPALDWNGARLAPTIALVHGYALYYPATSGPMLSTVYGPLAPFAFLPAALFTTPTPALLCAAAINVAFVVVPLLWFGWHTRPAHRTSGLLAVVTWLGVCAALARTRAGDMWLTMIHPDAPALGLGLLACAALWTGDRAPTPRRLHAAAVLAALSCAMKQVVVPLPAALGLLVWATHGRHALLDYVRALALSGVVVAGSVFVLGGPAAALFNAVTIATHQPWIRPGLAGLLAGGRLLLQAMAESLAILVVATLVGRRLTARPRQPTSLPLAAALALVPTGVLGALKMGGDQNSFYSLYFAAAAAASLLAWSGGALPARSWRRAFRVACYLYCAANVALAWRAGRYDARHTGSPFANANQEAYDYLRRHPGETYFPWHPLAALLAEGTLYHFDFAAFDRWLAGFPPTREHVLAHVPAGMREIASTRRPWLLGYFPEYSRESTRPDLPGWRVFSPPEPR
jgi:hypothetical protein